MEILSKAKQKTMFAHYKTCCTNSTEVTIHGSIWKQQQSPRVFLHYAKNLIETLCMLQKYHQQQAYLLPEAILRAMSVVVLFAVLLFHLDTNSSHAHSQQQSTKSTTARQIQITLLFLMYSLQAVEIIHGDRTMTQSTMQKAIIHCLHFTVIPTSVGHMSFTLQLHKN